ncbi:unnamed protein product [Nezara viridula]|uniref:Transcription initiation factor IIA subunit 1 n=1 Tax=Nezara viridula TaxID=85310 RepID=A0A9P0HIN3_NEZVI|nr:unnamed protein product [Nezara viridula]
MSLSQTTVGKLYASVIDDVIGGVREFFQDEGVDEQVLMELKNIWETKLQASKAIDPRPDDVVPPALKQPVTQRPVGPQLIHGNSGMPVEFPNKNVSIQITLPAQQGVPDSQPRAITIQVPASALQGNQLQQVLTGPVITATMAMPPNLAPTLLQQHVTAALQGQATTGIIHQIQHPVQSSNSVTVPNTANSTNFPAQNSGMTQLDGHNDTSDEEEEEEEEEEDEAEDDDDDVDEDKDEEDNEENEGGAEEEPLNSGDDVSEEDPSEMFETDNVVVCQYDKITRTRNKWKFYLKDGIMNLGGKDYVFQKSNGDAEW